MTHGGELASRRLVVALGVALAVLVVAVVSLLVLQGRDSGSGDPNADSSLPEDSSTEAPQVPVVPGTIPSPGKGVADLQGPLGFGGETTGAAGGEIYVVTSDADSPSDPQPGTLRYGLGLKGKVWIVFDRDMTITFAAPMRVTSDKTIDGRGHTVELTGPGVGGLEIYDATNVIVENLTLRDFGDESKTSENDVSDAIDIQRSSRVWIDHCSLSGAGDKLIAVADGGRLITISWNHFSDQEQTLQIGSMSTAEEDASSTVTVHHNFFDRVGYRMPVVSYGKAHVYNNYMLDWQVYAVRSERTAQVSLEANVFEAGDNRHAALVVPGQDCNDSGTLCDTRLGYLRSVANEVIGKATIRVNEPEHVFEPSDSYAYTASEAGADLIAAIVAEAGAAAA